MHHTYVELHLRPSAKLRWLLPQIETIAAVAAAAATAAAAAISAVATSSSSGRSSRLNSSNSTSSSGSSIIDGDSISLAILLPYLDAETTPALGGRSFRFL